MQRIATSVLVSLCALALTASVAQAKITITGWQAGVYTSAATETPAGEQSQAGSTPDVGVTEFTIGSDGAGGLALNPNDNVKDVRVDLPPGLISFPSATAQCTQTDFSNNACATTTEVGTVTVTVSGVDYTTNVYNLVPAAGVVSDFGFSVMGVIGSTHIIGGVRDTGDYGLYFTISGVNVPLFTHSKLTFWGDPAANNGAATHKAFIRLPTFCDGIQSTKLTVTSQAGDTATASYDTHSGATGCDKVPFDPSLTVTPDTTQQDSPVGPTIDLHVPQDLAPGTPTTTTDLASSHVQSTVVTLPPGLTINPSAANGLAACSDAQFGMGTHNPIACPDASKVGTVSIVSPALSGPLTGSVFLGTPQPGNPYRLFVNADGFGLSVRLMGTVTPDPVTGQLTTTFANTPQVPFTDFILNFAGGPGATLANPLACGTATTTSSVTPYSGNPPATASSSFTVDADGKGGACPAAPFSLGFSAGTQDMTAGAFSPFTLTVTRADGQQYLGGLTVTEPPGLLGVIQSVPLCDDASASAGTCPDASRVGTSTVTSGAGSAPFSLSGPVYLAGPYGGGPFSLVIAVRALAGPFDLGTVVVRAPIKVDPTDSHLTIDSSTLPTILQGIPLRLRSVTVAINRSSFIFNPTSCSALAVGATLISTTGATQDVSSPFQATGCDALPYGPKMTATSQAARRGDPAGLTVNLTQGPGEANTRSVSVKLPSQLGARLSTINQACPEATFTADPSTCDAGSKVGTVAAVTPLLAQPLGGTVYLEAHKPPTLPTLQAVLQGSGITVDLGGTLNLSNGIQSTFGTVPDVPISSFTLTLPPSASNSALTATADLCSATLPLVATITGQNGKTVNVNSTVGVAGCGVAITAAKVKGHSATLTVRTPAAGTLTVSGKATTKASKRVAAAGSYKLTVKLTKPGLKALGRALHQKNKKRRKLTVALNVSFTPAKGALAGGQPVKASSAGRKLVFKR